MGRTRTWLVAAAVVLLGLAATIEAVVGGEGDRRAARPAEAETARSEAAAVAADALADASAYGILLYIDEACAVHALTLPHLERGSPPPTPAGERACTFTTSPGGSFGVGRAAPRPESPLVARCAGGRIAIGTQDGSVVAHVPGCPPAWKPTGDLTAVLRGELVDLPFPLRGVLVRPPRTLLSSNDLRRAFGGSPWRFAAPAIRSAVWLDDERVAVVVSNRGRPEDALAVFERGRLVGGPPSPYERLSRLRASPQGSYVAAQVGDPGGVVVVDRRGELVSFPFRGARAVAWSRDEVWAAAATSDAIYVFETERPTRFVRLPIAARDLVWR